MRNGCYPVRAWADAVLIVPSKGCQFSSAQVLISPVVLSICRWPPPDWDLMLSPAGLHSVASCGARVAAAIEIQAAVKALICASGPREGGGGGGGGKGGQEAPSTGSNLCRPGARGQLWRRTFLALSFSILPFLLLLVLSIRACLKTTLTECPAGACTLLSELCSV